MKFLLSLFTLCLSTLTWANQAAIDAVRKHFHSAVLEPVQESRIVAFHTYMQSVPTDLPVMKAYHAVAEALLAQTLWSPYDKYKQVKKFEELINAAIASEPNSLEIRFLRFCVQYNVPKFLGLDNNLDEDRTIILSNLERVHELQVDRSFVRYIITFMKDTGLCDAAHIALIETKLSRS